MSSARVYEPFTAIDPFAAVPGVGQLAAPPGVSIQAGTGVELFDNLITNLRLPMLGTFTPWAAREEVDWDLVPQPPETNVIVAGINDATLAQAAAAAFGMQLPWIAVFSEVLPSSAEVREAYGNSVYEFFHTQAVYDQADPNDPPRIVFLHWGRLRDQPATMAATKSMDQVAGELEGQLVFAAQVNYDTTRLRNPPATPFRDAFGTQFGVPTPAPPQPTPTPIEPPPTPTQPVTPGLPAPPPAESPWKTYALPMAATAIAFGVGGYFLVRHLRKPTPKPLPGSW
jgi:hypothetical protein